MLKQLLATLVALSVAVPAQATPITPTPPDRVIQMGKTIPLNRLCHTLQVAASGKIKNFSPCVTELGDRVCLLNVTPKTDRIARCWHLNKPSGVLPATRFAGFVPDRTPPPNQGPGAGQSTNTGTGTRFVAFVPLAQVSIPQPLQQLITKGQAWYAAGKAKDKAKRTHDTCVSQVKQTIGLDYDTKQQKIQACPPNPYAPAPQITIVKPQ